MTVVFDDSIDFLVLFQHLLVVGVTLRWISGFYAFTHEVIHLLGLAFI